VILHQLGGDFRYVDSMEIQAMLDSYTNIMSYFNAHPELGVDMRFGTLNDYFEAMKTRAATNTYPSVIGDFLPYCDRLDHYWSGYFTSRAHSK